MEYRKIPLERQLRKIAKGYCAHPEYMPAAIRAWGGNAGRRLPRYRGQAEMLPAAFENHGGGRKCHDICGGSKTYRPVV